MTTKKHTYEATLPDGNVITRTTARTYTHAIAVRATYPDDASEAWKHRDSGRWILHGFAGSAALAAKEVTTLTRIASRRDPLTIEVQVVEIRLRGAP